MRAGPVAGSVTATGARKKRPSTPLKLPAGSSGPKGESPCLFFFRFRLFGLARFADSRAREMTKRCVSYQVGFSCCIIYDYLLLFLLVLLPCGRGRVVA